MLEQSGGGSRTGAVLENVPVARFPRDPACAAAQVDSHHPLQKRQRPLRGLCPFFWLVWESNHVRSCQWNCGFALPVADEAKPQFPQRSKNARISVSPMRFSGTARWNVHEPVRKLANTLIFFPRGGEKMQATPIIRFFLPRGRKKMHATPIILSKNIRFWVSFVCSRAGHCGMMGAERLQAPKKRQRNAAL